jgi:adenosylcobinamide kinase/adenosylcobinamide-phosphate guanylyltransferase
MKNGIPEFYARGFFLPGVGGAMAHVILITGGARSGKSEYARQIAEAMAGPRVFVATCTALDAEMAERIKKHQEARSGGAWRTVEEPLDLAGALRRADGYRVLLVDCLTLWINNLMYAAQQLGQSATEEDIEQKCREVLQVCSDLDATVIFVTNEVGMGIVPDNPLSRLYRDRVGRCNQIVAEAADEVILVSCGLPLPLKKGKR